MLNWEYINFNELLPFCDPGVKLSRGRSKHPICSCCFPLLQHGHQVKYSFSTFLQWISCFITYMSSSKPPENSLSICGRYTKSKSRDHPQQGLVGYRHNFSRCFTGKVRKIEGCTNCGSLKHKTTECSPKKGKCPAREETRASSPKQPKQKPDVCFSWNYNRPWHLNPCLYKHGCIKCSPEEHWFLDCPK